MQVLLNGDGRILAGEDLAPRVRAALEDGLGHLTRRLTRVEVHLSDVNGPKGGHDDKRCLMEARIKGLAPVAASDTADNLEQAIAGAVRKLHAALAHLVERRADT